jgi:hypothetical protein
LKLFNNIFSSEEKMAAPLKNVYYVLNRDTFTTKGRPFYCVKPAFGAHQFFVMTYPDHLGRVPIA